MLQRKPARESPRLRPFASAAAAAASYAADRDDGYPAGLIGWAGDPHVTPVDGDGVRLTRRDYATGDVSVVVTVTVGADADASVCPVCRPRTVAWVNGELGEKRVTFDAVEAAAMERAGVFRVSVGSPTGGAVVAADAISRCIRISGQGVRDSRGGRGGSGASRLLVGLLDLLGLARRRIAR